MLEWLSAEHPDWNVSEWIDEQIGFLIKYGVPILSATRTEWLAGAQPESIVVQTPGRLSRDERKSVLAFMRERPALAIGRADAIDPAVLELAGARTNGVLQPKGFVRASAEPSSLTGDLPGFNVLHLPVHYPIEAMGEVLFRTEATPTLVRRENVSYWQPPDWSEPSNQFLPRYQIGSLASHALAARALIDAAARAGCSHIAHVPFAQPLAFHLWRSAGRIHILLGNLETGLTGDARTERHATLVLNRQHLGLGAGDYVLRDAHADGHLVRPSGGSPAELRFEVRVEPEGSALYVVTPGESAA
jgi:hypothetical protein